MGILLWIILGGLAGWIASMLMGTRNSMLSDIILGIVGAVVGGFVMNLLGQQGVNGFNLYSLIVSIVGAVVLIFLARVFRSS